MDNGEMRFYLESLTDHSSYVRTEMPQNEKGWQNSHSHKGIIETFVVQSGWIGFVELHADHTLGLRVYKNGEVFTTEPGKAHNVYMPAGAVIHTIKHGDCSDPKDWIASPELDALTKSLTEEEILKDLTV